MKYGYIRVSTKEQNTDRQYEAMKAYQIPRGNLYCDMQSGKDFSRPAYKRIMKRLQPGDLLIVKSIDRLGRNYKEIIEQWRKITKEIGADILIIDIPLLDTRAKEHDLTGTLVADLVLQLLAYVAQTERDFIRQRQAEGIAAAKAKGKRLGRKPSQLPDDFGAVCDACEQGSISTRQAAQILGISHTTFYRRYKDRCVKRDEEDKNFVSISRPCGTPN